MSDEFNVLRDSLMFINLMMEDKLVPQMRFTYTYSSPASYRNPINWETTISEAGNLTSLGMMAFGKKWNEKNKKLYKTSYSQFLKLETDFTKTWSLDEYSSLVAHLNLGVMYSYGNSYKDTAPFTEYFYVGGASSLRGWPARYIGPGDFTLDFDNRSLRFVRIGTIKAMANLEYRPRLFGNLYGAVFLDAGNVWLHESLLNNTFGNFDDIEAAEVPETNPAELDDETVDKVVGFLSSLDHGDIRTSRLGNDFALNTGIGLRYDLGFITLRLDWGLGLHLPYQTGRSGYFNADTFGRDQTLHFAVGMPF
jgi:outer membrane protein assembly factor BamA